MQLDHHILAVRHQLELAASAGGAAVAEAAPLLTAGLEPALRLALQGILAEAAGELTAQLDGLATVEVRLRADGPDLVALPAPPDGVDHQVLPPMPSPVRAEEPEVEADPVGEEIQTRFTLRVPEALKSRIDAAAAEAQVSVNTWLLGAARTRLDQPSTAGASATTRDRSRRLSGWVG